MRTRPRGDVLTRIRSDRDAIKCRVEVQGERVTLAECYIRQEMNPFLKRGNIVTFSDAARRRMLRMIAGIDWDAAGSVLFTTLTYPPSEENHTMKERSTHRAKFHRFIEHHFGRQVGALWRVEWKERKSGPTKGQVAPHIHQLYFGVRFLSKRLCAEKWGKAIGCKTPPVVDVQRLDTYKKVRIYICKYCAKKTDVPLLDYVPYRNRTGRHSGIMRKNLIPWHPLEIFHDVAEDVVDLVTAKAEEVLPWYDQKYGRGVTLLGSGTVDLAEKIRNMVVAERTVSG